MTRIVLMRSIAFDWPRPATSRLRFAVAMPRWMPVDGLKSIETKAYGYYASAKGRVGRTLAFEVLFHIFGLAEVYAVLWLLAGEPRSDPALRGGVKRKLERAVIFAASHYATPGDTMRRACESIRQELAGRGLTVQTKLAMGDPATEIIKIAAQEGVDLIAMSTHGHRFLSDLIHGTTVDKVRHTVRVPVYLQKALKRINQATIRLGDSRATPEEIATVSDLDENLISSALSAARTSYSLDADHGESSDGARLRDLLVDAEAPEPYRPELEDVTLETGLEKALGDLGEREQLVLRMRFGIGMDREYTLAEVAERLHVSVERVRQIQVRALAKLDTPSLRRELEPLL